MDLLPFDILSTIFWHVPRGAPISFYLGRPPALSSSPWVLGRVCSHWRSVSRSDLRLWGRPDVGVRSNSIRSLQYAASILPPAVLISISVWKLKTENPDFNLNSLVPYLNRCEYLDMGSDDISHFNNFWSVQVPRDALINLHELSLQVDDSSQLWECLDSKVFPAEPLQMASQLRRVKLLPRMDRNRLQIVMTIGIPWAQLTHLEINGVSDILALSGILQQCNSLTELDIRTMDKVPQTKFDDTIHIPHLCKLRLLDDKHALWIPLHSWERLTDLELATKYPGDLLQHELPRCVNLTNLSFVLPPDFPLKPLSLPSLRSLTLSTSLTGRPPLGCFILPKLEDIDIYDFGELDLASVSDMFENSNCPLSSFIYRGPNAIVYPVSLHHFLTSISSPAYKSPIKLFFVWSVFSDHILNDIGAGTLLPNLKELMLIPESQDDMLDLLEKRVDREVQLRRGRLTKWRIYAGRGAKAERLRNLCLRAPAQVDIQLYRSRVPFNWRIMFDLSEEEIEGLE